MGGCRLQESNHRGREGKPPWIMFLNFEIHPVATTCFYFYNKVDCKEVTNEQGETGAQPDEELKLEAGFHSIPIPSHSSEISNVVVKSFFRLVVIYKITGVGEK